MFPLPTIQPVRCRNPLCRRWLHDPESVARGFGRQCAEERGLVAARRLRWPVVHGEAADTPNLLDLINEGEIALGYTTCDHDYAPSFGGPRPAIVTLCGSTRFKDAFEAALRTETLAGKLVISVGLFGHIEGLDMGDDDAPSDTKVMLDELHKRKIDLADEILVVSDSSGYYGASTRSEIAYAKATGKPVRFYRQPA